MHGVTQPVTVPGREHWEQSADAMLLAVRPYASERHAQIRLPGPASHNGAWSDGLEGFARTFLLAAFRLGGAGGRDPHGFAEWYARGITAGVDPDSPERWPTFAESNQAKVEAASVALALHETRPWIWDRLTARTREQLLDWLGAMVDDAMPGNNWIWFQAVTEAFARTVGGRWSEQDLRRTIALTDHWYTGGGWYSDGLTGDRHRNYDHYNGWAMHLYPLWFCRILGERAPHRLLERYRDRLRRFLSDYRHLVGGNGAPLIQGRSLTYRYAALAPVWLGALFEATPLSPGETRGLTGRMLGYFERGGALTGEGVLSLGWHRPFRGLLQTYSGPASPYWASKGFAGLLLPPEHAVWTAAPEPLAVERGDFARALDAPGWLVSGTASDGVVRVINHGSDHADPGRPQSDDPCYARLCYSTHAAPEMPADPSAGPWDSTATLVDEHGTAAHRRPLERVASTDTVGVSRSRAHWPVDPADAAWDPFGGPVAAFRTGPWITVGSALRGAVEVRLVRVDPAPPPEGAEAQPGPLRLRVGGWALPAGSDAARAVAGRASVTAPDGLVSTLVDLSGLPKTRVRTARDSNPLSATSATPLLYAAGEPVPGRVYAAAVHLGGTPLTDAALPTLATTRTPEGDTETVVSWPTGERDTVRLPPPPLH